MNEDGLNRDLSAMGKEVVEICRGIECVEGEQPLYDLPDELENSALIKYVRQLEKEKAYESKMHGLYMERLKLEEQAKTELLAALKPFSKAKEGGRRLIGSSTGSAYHTAQQVYTKHSTDTGERLPTFDDVRGILADSPPKTDTGGE